MISQCLVSCWWSGKHTVRKDVPDGNTSPQLGATNTSLPTVATLSNTETSFTESTFPLSFLGVDRRQLLSSRISVDSVTVKVLNQSNFGAVQCQETAFIRDDRRTELAIQRPVDVLLTVARSQPRLFLQADYTIRSSVEASNQRNPGRFIQLESNVARVINKTRPVVFACYSPIRLLRADAENRGTFVPVLLQTWDGC